MEQSKLTQFFTDEPVCPYCGKKFANKGALQSHIKQVHYHIKPKQTNKNEKIARITLPEEFTEWCKANNIKKVNLEVINDFLAYKQLQEIRRHNIVS
jgi:hypothetical protein